MSSAGALDPFLSKESAAKVHYLLNAVISCPGLAVETAPKRARSLPAQALVFPRQSPQGDFALLLLRIYSPYFIAVNSLAVSVSGEGAGEPARRSPPQ